MSRLFAIWSMLLGLCSASLADSPKPGPAHNLLKLYVFSVNYEGETDAAWEGTEYGPSGKFEGNSNVQFILNGFFAHETWEEQYPTGDKLGGTIIYGYDAKEKQYYADYFMSNGLKSYARIDVDGDTMTQQFEQTSAKGDKSLVKGVWNYNADKSEFTAKWELSFDDGKTWKSWLTYKGTKTKARKAVSATITAERRFTVPPERLFELLTDSEARKRIEPAPQGYEIVYEESFDLKTDGFEKSRMRQGEKTIAEFEQRYLDVTKDKRIVFSAKVSSNGQPLSCSMNTMELIPNGDGTLLSCKEQVTWLHGQEMRALHENGWSDLFDRIAKEFDK